MGVLPHSAAAVSIAEAAAAHPTTSAPLTEAPSEADGAVTLGEALLAAAPETLLGAAVTVAEGRRRPA